MTPDRTKAARELLAFYLEAGADALLAEEPVDRFAGGEAAPALRPMVRDAGLRPAPHHQALGDKRALPRPEERAAGARLEGRAAPAPPSAPASPEAAMMDARAQARAAENLDEL